VVSFFVCITGRQAPRMTPISPVTDVRIDRSNHNDRNVAEAVASRLPRRQAKAIVGEMRGSRAERVAGWWPCGYSSREETGAGPTWRPRGARCPGRPWTRATASFREGVPHR
jgi:hypothetical protein